MSDLLGVKISELPEITDLEGTHTIGTDKNTKSGKVSLGFIKEAANYANAQGDYAKEVGDAVAGNVGSTDYPEFSASGIYAIGDVVRYNGRLYRFTAPHQSGAWNGADVILTSVNSEVKTAISEFDSTLKTQSQSIVSYKETINAQVDGQNQEIDAFKEAVTDQVNNYAPIIINGDVTNAPDEEDLTSVNGLLKFKNRSALNGMGYVILRRDKTFAEQVTLQNSIYEIRYNFDLNGAEVTIPGGCVLKFEGGKIMNGVIIGTQTSLQGSCDYDIFRNCEIKGMLLSYIDVRWFGAMPDLTEDYNGTDNSYYFDLAIKASINHSGTHVKVIGKYLIGTTIEVEGDLNLQGVITNNRELLTNESVLPSNTMSMIYVRDCSAFKVVGRGETAKFANINITNLEAKGSGINSTSVFVEYTATGAPTRVGQIADCLFSGFSKALYFIDNMVHDTGTVYGNLTIERVFAFYNAQFLVTKSQIAAFMLCNLIIRDSTIEQNGIHAIELEKMFSSTIIDNCILEGQETPIKATISGGSIQISNNYFERCGGDYLVDIKGLNRFNCYAKYYNNYKMREAEGIIKLSDVTISEFNQVKLTNKLDFSNSIIDCHIPLKLTSESFSQCVNTKDLVIFNSAVDTDGVYPLFFGGENITSQLLGKVCNSENMSRMASSFNVNLVAGDTIILCYYVNGSHPFALYNENGANISGGTDQLYASPGMMVVKKTITGNAKHIYLYSSGSAELKFGNGYIYKDTNSRVVDMGIEGDTISPFVDKSAVSQSSAKERLFFLRKPFDGLYYGDGENIRNVESSYTDRREQVTQFTKWVNFTKPDTIYSIIGDVDLGGQQVVIPTGCTLDFSHGGTITNGNLTLQGTWLILPDNIVENHISAQISGTYSDGQLLFDAERGLYKVFVNGEWKYIAFAE